MTSRPAFSPLLSTVGVDDLHEYSFAWNPGFSFSQKQKNVKALHGAIREKDPTAQVLEVSSKSLDEIGVCLSAFNLSVAYKNERCTVESVFQASKVFEESGPFPELYTHESKEVRDYVREHALGGLVAFEAFGTRWPLNPTRAFYDWVYIRALVRNPELAEGVLKYDYFTDIEFNPKKSLNCQAYAVALYVSLYKRGVLEDAISCKDSFLKYHPADVVVIKNGKNVKKEKAAVQDVLGI